MNDATIRVLEANGFKVRLRRRRIAAERYMRTPAIWKAHARSRDETSQRLSRSNQAIITNAGGCGAMLVSYAHLLASDAAFAERAGSSARVCAM